MLDPVSSATYTTTEPTGATINCSIAVTLSAASSSTVTVDYATSDYTALARIAHRIIAK